MPNVATGIILAAGTLTFANEWLQTDKPDWKVPVATLILGAIFDGLSHLDKNAATGLSVIVLIGALTVKFNGVSAAQEITDTLGGKSTKTRQTLNGGANISQVASGGGRGKK
jgi:hypothetical protein